MDDTIVIGLVNNNDETGHRNAIKYVTEWCFNNYLDLNVTKTKEMVFNFRKNKHTKILVNVDGSDVQLVKSYKYLGIIIQDDLKWDSHIEAQIKKANKKIYHVNRCLRISNRKKSGHA